MRTLFLFQTGAIKRKTTTLSTLNWLSSFLFQTGAIKRWGARIGIGGVERRFYSKLVRLKGIPPINRLHVGVFLFQTGAIKRASVLALLAITPMFLFQTGAIKSTQEISAYKTGWWKFLFQTGAIKR